MIRLAVSSSLGDTNLLLLTAVSSPGQSSF